MKRATMPFKGPCDATKEMTLGNLGFRSLNCIKFKESTRELVKLSQYSILNRWLLSCLCNLIFTNIYLTSTVSRTC